MPDAYFQLSQGTEAQALAMIYANHHGKDASPKQLLEIYQTALAEINEVLETQYFERTDDSDEREYERW